MELCQTKPVPVPRSRQRLNYCSSKASINEPDYENVQFVRSLKKPKTIDESPPVPAPRRTTQEDDSRKTFYQNVTAPMPRSNSTSPAISERSTINSAAESSPTRLNFDADDSSFRKTKSDEVSFGSDDGRKNRNISPGLLITTIGAASKMLTESITERVSQKTIKVTTRLDRSMKSFRSASKSNSNLVEDKGTSIKIRRSYSTGDDGTPEIRQMSATENGNSDIMRIQFSSPLEEDPDYDVPKRTNFLQTPLYEELESASSKKPPETFTRSDGMNQSLYTRPTSKKDRLMNHSGAKNPKRQHLYEELDIIPRQRGSSSSEEDSMKSDKNKVAYKSIRSSMLEELRNNLNLCSDTWNFYDVSCRDQMPQEDDDASPAIYEAIDEFASVAKTDMSSELAMIEEMLGDELYGRRIAAESSMKDSPPMPLVRSASKLELSVKLSSVGVDKLLDEEKDRPYLAVVDEPSTGQKPVDFGYPESGQSKPVKSRASHPPSYEEATAGADQEPFPPTSKPSTRSKWLKVLKRRSSSTKVKEEDARIVLIMVPKPPLTERAVSHQGLLIKFPSGMIGNEFNDVTPVDLRDKIVHVTQLKEALDLRCMSSLQSIVQKKLNGEGGLDIYCFEIVLVIPKNQRQSHMLGVHKQSDRILWMAKILQSVTDVFPGICLAEFTSFGWCYMKKSVSSDWSGAWILLAKRTLYLYNNQDRQLEQIDLRKARCIGWIESDNSIRNLYVEPGSTMFIDCPPYATLYFVMSSPQETQTWRQIIKETAHKNGNSLHSQQLTKSDIPVVIDKCINFIYAHGSMSEGIYRKSGLSRQVAKILQLFKEDAFAVQLTRTEFNEHDVAETLKKFIRDMPNSILGAYAVNLVSIAAKSSTKDKIDSYKEHLENLPDVEYNTLKKVIAHLNFIASLEKYNKMGITNLAMIWASTLMANSNQDVKSEQLLYSQDEVNVVADLIKLYKNVFTVTSEEVRMELQMLQVLQKYHAAAENMSDSAKHAGDFLVWITIDCNGEEGGSGERTQVNVTLTPTKTAADICKELAGKTPHQWYQLTLFEVIEDGAMVRPVHYGERALESVLRWIYWEEADRKSNYLSIRTNSLLSDVHRQIQKAPILTPITELKFADRKCKALRSFKLQLIGKEIYVLKMDRKDRITLEESTKIDLRKVYAYIGREAKREQAGLRWAITLVEQDFRKRSRDSPFIGHLFGGVDFNEQILWYSSILHSLHRDDILPSSDLFF